MDTLKLYSNPEEVIKRGLLYGVVVKISDRKGKKYMVYNPNKRKWVYFGQMGYEDFTKHKDNDRRISYLKRTAGIRGNWKNDMYSPNNLSRNLLW
jgi:hypothetical protein